MEDYIQLRKVTGIGLMDAKYMLQDKTYDEALEYIQSGKWDSDRRRSGIFIDKFNHHKKEE